MDDFFDRFKKSVVRKQTPSQKPKPKSTSKKNTGLTLFQKWSRGHKQPLQIIESRSVRQPLKELQNVTFQTTNHHLPSATPPCPTTVIHQQGRENRPSSGQYVLNPKHHHPVESSQLNHTQKSFSVQQPFDKHEQLIENELTHLLDLKPILSPVKKRDKNLEETRPRKTIANIKCPEKIWNFHNAASTRTKAPANDITEHIIHGKSSTLVAEKESIFGSFDDIVLDNGKIYVESSAIRNRFLRMLTDENDVSIGVQPEANETDWSDSSSSTPLIDPDLAYMLSESTIVTDHGAHSFYDLVPNNDGIEEHEKHLAREFLQVFKTVENMNADLQLSRRVVEFLRDKREKGSEIVFNGQEPWLTLWDLKNEVYNISLTSELIYRPSSKEDDGCCKHTDPVETTKSSWLTGN